MKYLPFFKDPTVLKVLLLAALFANLSYGQIVKGVQHADLLSTAPATPSSNSGSVDICSKTPTQGACPAILRARAAIAAHNGVATPSAETPAASASTPTANASTPATVASDSTDDNSGTDQSATTGAAAPNNQPQSSSANTSLEAGTAVAGCKDCQTPEAHDPATGKILNTANDAHKVVAAVQKPVDQAPGDDDGDNVMTDQQRIALGFKNCDNAKDGKDLTPSNELNCLIKRLSKVRDSDDSADEEGRPAGERSEVESRIARAVDSVRRAIKNLYADDKEDSAKSLIEKTIALLEKAEMSKDGQTDKWIRSLEGLHAGFELKSAAREALPEVQALNQEVDAAANNYNLAWNQYQTCAHTSGCNANYYMQVARAAFGAAQSAHADQLALGGRLQSELGPTYAELAGYKNALSPTEYNSLTREVDEMRTKMRNMSSFSNYRNGQSSLLSFDGSGAALAATSPQQVTGLPGNPAQQAALNGQPPRSGVPAMPGQPQSAGATFGNISSIALAPPDPFSTQSFYDSLNPMQFVSTGSAYPQAPNVMPGYPQQPPPYQQMGYQQYQPRPAYYPYPQQSPYNQVPYNQSSYGQYYHPVFVN